MNNIRALTKLVITESLRRRLYLFVGLAVAIVVLITFVIPASDPAARIQNTQSWLFSSISFLGAITILFVVGTSIPGDLRKGRLTTLFTKPVYRWQLILSKFFGFGIVLLVFTLIMGAVGYALLLGISFRARQPVLLPREKLQASSFRFVPKRETKQNVYRGGSVREDQQDRIDVFGSGTTAPLAEWKFNTPEGTYHQPPELLISVDGQGADNQYSIKLRFFLYIARTRNRNGRRGEKTEWVQVNRKIKKVNASGINKLTLSSDEFSSSEKTYFNQVDQIRVDVALANPAARLRFSKNSLTLTSPGRSFFVHYGKALILIYFLFLLLIGFLVLVTPVLSGPLSICVALLFYMIGSMMPFFRDALEVTRATLRQRGSAGAGGHHHTPIKEFPSWLLQYSQFVSEQVLSIIPDFNSFTAYTKLMNGWVIPNRHLTEGLGQIAMYSLLFVLFGTMFLTWREIQT